MILQDFSNLKKRGIYANKPAIIENPSFIAHVVFNMILNANQQFGASKQNPVVLAIDSKPSWRNTFYVENSKDFPEYEGQTYKGDRKSPDEELDWETINSSCEDVLTTLKKYSDFHIVKVDDCEADDIIAVLAKDCQKRQEACWIVSMDKDFIQLQDTFINIFDPIKKLILPAIDTTEYLQCHIMAAGDDNIKHIATRLGKGTAKKIYPKMEEYLALNPEAKKRYDFNKSLIDFNCIPEHLCGKILETWNQESHSYNMMKLIETFRKYRLNVIGERLNEFKLNEGEVKTKLNSHNEMEIKKEVYFNNSLADFFD